MYRGLELGNRHENAAVNKHIHHGNSKTEFENNVVVVCARFHQKIIDFSVSSSHLLTSSYREPIRGGKLRSHLA